MSREGGGLPLASRRDGGTRPEGGRTIALYHPSRLSVRLSETELKTDAELNRLKVRGGAENQKIERSLK